MTSLDVAAPEFTPFGKIPRLVSGMVVTEKIDGTNAAVVVTEGGLVFAQSRKRLITPDDDNFGFAAWVEAHDVELRDGLGPGVHFGEWWGHGIQRGYDLPKGERRFSLFNVSRWADDRPACCGVVPTLYAGQFSTIMANHHLDVLMVKGSAAAPGFMRPEGVMVYHARANQMFKLPFDPLPKGR